MSKAVENLQAAQKRAMAGRPKVGGFPYLAETLRRAGVTRNLWSLPFCQSLYLTSDGPVVMVLTPQGRMAVLTIGGPAEAAYLLFSALFGSRRVRFPRNPPAHELLAALTDYVDSKGIKPIIEGSHALDDIASAHRALEAGGGFGKHVVNLI
jgi:Zinc-binding dehydrogenase